MGEGERVSWKSGTGEERSERGVFKEAWVEPGGVGETRSSRHWRLGFWGGDGVGEETEVMMGEGLASEDAGTETS